MVVFYLFMVLITSALAVLSMDLIPTRTAGVTGERACLAGKKFSIALMILLPMDWRLRTRIERQFNVAFTRRGSLGNS